MIMVNAVKMHESDAASVAVNTVLLPGTIERLHDSAQPVQTALIKIETHQFRQTHVRQANKKCGSEASCMDKPLVYMMHEKVKF